MKVEDLKNPQPGDYCLVCGGTPAVIGIFKPEEPEAWGAAPGKIRLIRYCLCNRCHGRPQTPEDVEKIIKAELVGGATYAE